MEAKRMRTNNDDIHQHNSEASVDDKILSSDINNPIQSVSTTMSYPYHTSTCGSLLYSVPSKSSSDIFAYLRHNNFDAFRRSLDVYYDDIIRMRNEHGQTVLHVLVIHAYPYLWIRLLMMRGCDTCAQDFDGYTAAHYAVERDDVEMLKALTMRFHYQTKMITEERITEIHGQCLKALTLKEKQNLTVFMLASRNEALKSLDYLLQININDSHLEDQFGDTCLHYAAARRNQILIDKLINTCKADVNGGSSTRPSVLDIVHYNREQQKPSDRMKDDEIEQLLLLNKAINRCSIRRVTNKRKDPSDNEETVVSNLACLSIDLTPHGKMETARSHARIAASLRAADDFNGAVANYKQALIYASNDTLDWATYAYELADIHIIQGQQRLAFDLLQKAVDIRRRLETNSAEIDRIQQTIEKIQA